MAPSTAPAAPDTSDMVVVHRVFRREIHLLPVQVEAVPDGEGPRFDLVAAHAAELFSGLHHHHTAEDELLWPRLRERAPLDGPGRPDGPAARHGGRAARDGRRALPGVAAVPRLIAPHGVGQRT